MAPIKFGALSVVAAIGLTAATAQSQQFSAPSGDSPQEPGSPIPQSEVKRAATRAVAGRDRNQNLGAASAGCAELAAQPCANQPKAVGPRGVQTNAGNVTIEKWGNNFAPIYVDVRLGGKSDQRGKP